LRIVEVEKKVLNNEKIFILAGLLAFSSCAFAQSSYPNHAQLSTRLKTLSSKYATSTKLESIGKSKGGKDLFAITLSKGDASANLLLLS
jgi:hypothetical protein